MNMRVTEVDLREQADTYKSQGHQPNEDFTYNMNKMHPREQGNGRVKAHLLPLRKVQTLTGERLGRR